VEVWLLWKGSGGDGHGWRRKGFGGGSVVWCGDGEGENQSAEVEAGHWCTCNKTGDSDLLSGELVLYVVIASVAPAIALIPRRDHQAQVRESPQADQCAFDCSNELSTLHLLRHCPT